MNAAARRITGDQCIGNFTRILKSTLFGLILEYFVFGYLLAIVSTVFALSSALLRLAYRLGYSVLFSSKKSV
jgi:hypothetical protein